MSTKYGPIKTDHILFIASGAFQLAKPSDLLPELQGRLPIRVELDALNSEDFKRILKEPDNSLIKQYKALNETGNRTTAGTGKMGNVMKGVFSDGTLVVLTSAQNPNKRINFIDLYPINLSPLQFDVTGTDVAYLEADVTFNYRSFTVASA